MSKKLLVTLSDEVSNYLNEDSQAKHVSKSELLRSAYLTQRQNNNADEVSDLVVDMALSLIDQQIFKQWHLDQYDKDIQQESLLIGELVYLYAELRWRASLDSITTGSVDPSYQELLQLKTFVNDQLTNIPLVLQSALITNLEKTLASWAKQMMTQADSIVGRAFNKGYVSFQHQLLENSDFVRNVLYVIQQSNILLTVTDEVVDDQYYLLAYNNNREDTLVLKSNLRSTEVVALLAGLELKYEYDVDRVSSLSVSQIRQLVETIYFADGQQLKISDHLIGGDDIKRLWQMFDNNKEIAFVNDNQLVELSRTREQAVGIFYWYYVDLISQHFTDKTVKLWRELK